MKRFFRNLVLIVSSAIIGFAPLVDVASALPLTQQRPVWVYHDAFVDLDFANNRYWGTQVWYGTGNSSNGRSPSALVYNGSGAVVNTLFSQWRDGIVRKQTEQYQNRRTDYGLWGEGGPNNANNWILQSRDFTNASWTLTTITATKTGIVGADGTTGNATRLTATGANATALQVITNNGSIYANSTGIKSSVVTGGTGYTNGGTVTLAGATCTTTPTWTVTSSGGIVSAVTSVVAGSCSVLPANPAAVTGGAGVGLTINPAWIRTTADAWIKCITCTGAISITPDNTTFTDISGQLNTTSFIHVSAPYVNRVLNTTGIKIANNSDVIVVDFYQLESDDKPTSPILTTTGTNLRGPEMPAFGTPSSSPNVGLPIAQQLYWGTPVTFLTQYSGNFSDLANHLLSIGTDSADYFVTGAAGGGAISINGNGGSYNSGACVDTTGLFTLNKVAVRYDGNSSAVAVNGCLTKSASVKYTASPQLFTHAGFLNNGSNLTPTNGYEARWTAWKRALTDGEMVQITTVTNNQ